MICSILSKVKPFAWALLAWPLTAAPAYSQCVAPRFSRPLVNGTTVYAPAVADLNGDGIVDLVTGTRTVLKGRNDGTFEQAVPITVACNGREPQVHDVNNDGNPDIVTSAGDAVNHCAGGFSGVVLLSSPNGTFAAGPGFSGGVGVGNVPVTDWDGDGFVDLIGGGGETDRCSVVLRRGDGRSFGQGPGIIIGGGVELEFGVSLVIVTDLDSDGRSDLAYTVRLSDTSRQLRILRHGPGDRLETAPLFEAGYPAGICSILRDSDVDADGRIDLIVQSGDGFLIFLNRGAGGFDAVRSPLGGVGAVREFSIADMNSDRHADIVFNTFSEVGVLCGDGSGRFARCATVPLPASASGWSRVGDFNGDGKLDIAADTGSAGFVVVLNECQDGERTIGIVPTVVSGSGANGAFFRTRFRLSNPCAELVEGRLFLRPRAGQGSAREVTSPFVLGPHETLAFDDLVSAMGVDGSGSLDVNVSRGQPPVIQTEVFNSNAGEDVRGGAEPTVPLTDVLSVGFGGDLTAPRSLADYRFSIGVRALSLGAVVRATVKGPDGQVMGAVQRGLGPNQTIQQSAAEFLGFSLYGRERVSVTIVSGSALVFASIADNATSTPRIQVVTRTGTVELAGTPGHAAGACCSR